MGQAASNFIHISTFGLVPKSVTKGWSGGSKSDVSAPLPLPQAPSVDDAVGKAENISRKRKASQTQSVYTSPLGVSGEANVARKTLLGQ